MIYHLAGARIPTRYPFALHLKHNLVGRGLGFDPDLEVARILAERPRFIVVREDKATAKWRAYPLLESTLAAGYDRVACYPLYARARSRPVDVIFHMQPKSGKVALYQLREDPAVAAEPEPCTKR